MKIFQQLALTFIVFIVTVNYSQSQSFSIDARSHYGLSEQNETISTYDYSIISPILDSTNTLLQNIRSTTTILQEYTSKIGYSLQANIRFSKNRFSIKTGLGIEYTAFTKENISFDFSSIVLDQDTLNSIYPIQTSSSSYFPCNESENSFSDIEIEPGIHYRVLNLRIPLVIEYTFIPEKFIIGTGLLMHTPIYSSFKSEYVWQERISKENGHSVCKYVKKETFLENNTGISNLQIGFTANATYYVLKNVGIELGYSAELRNVFYTPKDDTPSAIQGGNFTPFRVFVGVEYRFGKPENDK